jgi:hypothetical protein
MVRLVVAFLAAALLSAQAQARVLITVDKSAQQMIVVVDGVERWVWPVSTGMRGYATPSGTFTAFRMEAEHYSKEFDDAPMPHSIFFTKRGHAIHGYLDTRRLGTAASHGCVRLAPANATKLYALVEREGVTNATVIITGGEPAAVARPRRAPEVDPQAQPVYQRAPPSPAYANPNAPYPGYPGYDGRWRGYYEPSPRDGYYERY